MNSRQFQIFDNFRKELKAYCQDFNLRFGKELAPLQAKAAADGGVPFYEIETPVVYNTALDELTEDSLITKIVIGDNPGKNEQMSANQKYLVGQAGKLAESFFRKNPEFNTCFRKNVIILNKTPVHSAKTIHLKSIVKNGSPELKEAINKSTLWMAEKTAELHINLCSAAESEETTPELWLVGYAELKGNGLFTDYRDHLKKMYLDAGNSPSFHSAHSAWDKVLVFQHFSMNRFTIDLESFTNKNSILSKPNAVHQLGKIHRQEIFAI